MRRVLVLVCATWAAASGMASANATLTLKDDVVIAEPTGRAQTAEFQVELLGAVAFPVTVRWATQDLTATSPDDYTAASGELTFVENRTLSIQVPIKGDSSWEGAETFLVNLLSPAGAELAQLVDGQAHGVITDHGSPAARCDLDGDGRSDVLIRTRLADDPVTPDPDPHTHYNGHGEWNLKGTVVKARLLDGTASRWALPNADHWEAVAANDFDGSGPGCDVLWKWNCTDGGHGYHGRLALTRAGVDTGVRPPEDAEVLADASLPAEWQSMSEWELVGSGKLDPDAKADVLWWNPASGKLRIWSSTGQGFAPAGDDLAAPALNSRAIGVLDIDDDGDADILWRNSDTGALFYWQMQAGLRVGDGPLTPSSLVDPCWQLVATGDFNGDGHDDLHWQNQNSQRSVVWFMRPTEHGPERIGGSYLSPDRFAAPNQDLTCPASCVRDCSNVREPWYVEGPR